mgnify:FL=1
MKVFRLFDEDNTGFITFRALKRICQEIGEGLYVFTLATHILMFIASPLPQQSKCYYISFVVRV